MSEASERALMLEAVQLSERGFPAPNPRVGCVIAKNGSVAGKGFHEYAGGPHAEVVALREAGTKARGATAFVTLEPCNHHGRTPPCAEALIQAGVAKVIVALADPNPRAQGGSERLREAGIEVETGLCEQQAAWVSRLYLNSHRQRRAVFGLKAAVTLDGRIALPNGQSKWITGEAARIKAHQLRAEYGAVLVGRATAELDNPSLTVRHVPVVNQPLRIVLDPGFRLDPHGNVFDGAAETLWVGAVGRLATAAKPNVEIVELDQVDGRLDLHQLATAVFDRGRIAVLVEGGGKTLTSFLQARLASELHLFRSPTLFGAGPNWLDGQLAETVAKSPRLRLVEEQSLGEDLYSHFILQDLQESCQ